jgi:hypothetical protein
LVKALSQALIVAIKGFRLYNKSTSEISESSNASYILFVC